MPVFIRTIELFALLFLNQNSSFGYLFIPWHQSKSPFREFFFFVYVFILFYFFFVIIAFLSCLVYLQSKSVCIKHSGSSQFQEHSSLKSLSPPLYTRQVAAKI